MCSLLCVKLIVISGAYSVISDLPWFYVFYKMLNYVLVNAHKTNSNTWHTFCCQWPTMVRRVLQDAQLPGGDYQPVGEQRPDALRQGGLWAEHTHGGWACDHCCWPGCESPHASNMLGNIKPVLNWVNCLFTKHTLDGSLNYNSFLNWTFSALNMVQTFQWTMLHF